MVKITIFIEGGVLPSRENPELTPGNYNLMRESFRQLFLQKIPEDKFYIDVEPSAGYKNAVPLFKSHALKSRNAVILLDFAEPAQNLRRANQFSTRKYSSEPFDINDPMAFRAECITELGLGEYHDRVFFMIQEMEAWILAQPDKIESFGQKEGFIRKQPEIIIASHNLLTRVAHPEEINNPKEALKAIFLQSFDQQKNTKDGKIRHKARAYSGINDGPKLIALLDLEHLMKTFSDARNLIDWILSTPYFLVIFSHPILTTKRT